MGGGLKSTIVGDVEEGQMGLFGFVFRAKKWIAQCREVVGIGQIRTIRKDDEKPVF